MTATVLRSGFLSSVQDLGRTGHRASGVSLGGALDPHALAVANLLVGNKVPAAGIEATLGELRIRFEDERLVAWAGGDFIVRVGGAEIAAGHAAVVRNGEELRMTAPHRGARAWLAISGGIDVPMVLGSRATDLRTNFGGLDGRALRDGDVLALGDRTAATDRIMRKIGAARSASWRGPTEWISPAPRHPFLRIVRGVDWSCFAETALNAFAKEAFLVTAESDRMGVRLTGAPLVRLSDEDLVSEAVTPGTIQVPPSGQPILLLGDCQTIGGYPKIAHVITVDLPSAAQLSPGDEVRFAEVALAEAQRLLLERGRDLERFKIGLELHAS